MGSTRQPELHKNPPRLLSVVVPFLNEEQALPRLIQVLERVISAMQQPWELVLVDDGSRDRSLEVARTQLGQRPDLTAQVISLSRNFGKEAALTAGLEAARGDVVVPLDADLQDPPELIGAMIEAWRKGYQVVYAVRKSRNGENWAKRFSAYAFYRLITRISDTQIPADTGDFRLMVRRCRRSLAVTRAHEIHERIICLGGIPANGHLLRSGSSQRRQQSLELPQTMVTRCGWADILQPHAITSDRRYGDSFSDCGICLRGMDHRQNDRLRGGSSRLCVASHSDIVAWWSPTHQHRSARRISGAHLSGGETTPPLPNTFAGRFYATSSAPE